VNGGNRSVTERLDTALYDKIKQYQKIFSDMVRVHVFNELLLEGGFDPIANPSEVGISDRCFFKFNEVDVDTQVKKETHIIQKYVSSLITIEEARILLGNNPEVDDDRLFSSMQVNSQIDMIKAQKATAQDMMSNMDGDKQQSSSGTQRNLPNNRKGPGNIVRPANQQGRRNSPDIKRRDSDLLSAVENLLEEEYTVIDIQESENSNEKN